MKQEIKEIILKTSEGMMFIAFIAASYFIISVNIGLIFGIDILTPVTDIIMSRPNILYKYSGLIIHLLLFYLTGYVLHSINFRIVDIQKTRN